MSTSALHLAAPAHALHPWHASSKGTSIWTITAGNPVFKECFKMMCSCAGADLCAVGHFSILFAVQSMAPHAGRATQGKGDHHGFYGGDAVPTFPSIVKQSSFKKSKWSWEWHTFFIFFLCSCCCWRTAIRYLTVCETLWSQNALFMYMARIIVPYQPGLVVATHRD